MEKLSYEDILNLHVYASDDLINSIPKDSKVYVNFAYTDYGGSCLDKFFISYFQEHYPNSIIVESTVYHGQNAILYGEVASDFWDECEQYPLSFEDTESAYSDFEYREKVEHIESFALQDFCSDLGIDCDNLKDQNRERIFSALLDHTEFDNGVQLYTSYIEGAKDDLKLGEPKFKMDWDAYDKRKGQNLLDL